jgi:hypothetical protein
MKEQIKSIEEGFANGMVPHLTNEGTSGTYILKSHAGESVAVFKPIDEEAFAPHNPRDMKADFGSNTCRSGVKSGEMTVREIIAFQLDHDNFSSVPATTFAEVHHAHFDQKYETSLQKIQG